jgi:hypothetical protein
MKAIISERQKRKMRELEVGRVRDEMRDEMR